MEKEEKKEIKEELKDEIIKKIKEEIRKDDDSPGGLFIPAGVLAGLGFGFLYGEVVSGLFIGLGIGFALFAIYEIFRINKE